MTEITQADRDAAELTLQDRLKQIFDDAGGSETLTDLLREFDFEGSRELADAIVWAMADSNRHRMEERAAIVVWLRKVGGSGPEVLADMIDAGGHLE